MLDLLKQTEIIVTLIIAVGGVLVTVAVWWDRRGQQYTDTRINSVAAGQGKTHERLDRLENRVDEIEDGVEQVNSRLGKVEGRIDTLATSQQVADLRERMGKVEGVVEQVDGKVDTIYRAFTDPYRGGGS